MARKKPMAATERLVVQVTVAQKSAIVAKARRYGLSTSALMLRGALAYDTDVQHDEVAALADFAAAAAARAGMAIDDALRFIAASNERIAQMQARRRDAMRAR
jgi:hypothetical protein